MSSSSFRGRVGRVATLCALVAGMTLAARRSDGAADAAFAAGTAHAVTGGVLAALDAPATALRDAATRPADGGERLLALLDSLRGRSGRLRARLVPRSPERAGALAGLLGDSLFRSAGVHHLRDSAGGTAFSIVTIRDFADKVAGRIGGYHIGFWPGERGPSFAGTNYANPQGFIEVTAENEDTQLSEHFRLRDFLTHDQQGSWPKYLVLREELVDKLELVIGELQLAGHSVTRMSVMSGFRTPQYNATGGETGGRASMSRHLYGDAADVFVGGVGVYRATAAHGPLAHVDVRGRRARWGLL